MKDRNEIINKSLAKKRNMKIEQEKEWKLKDRIGKGMKQTNEEMLWEDL